MGTVRVSQDKMCQKVVGGVEHVLASRVMGSGRLFVPEPSDGLGWGLRAGRRHREWPMSWGRACSRMTPS